MQKKLKADVRFSAIDYKTLENYLISKLDESKQISTIEERIKEVVLKYIKNYIVDRDAYELFKKSQRIASKIDTSILIMFFRANNQRDYIRLYIKDSDNIPINGVREWINEGPKSVIHNFSKDKETEEVLKKLTTDYILCRNILGEKIENLFPDNFFEFTFQDLLDYNKEWFDEYLELKGLNNIHVYGEVPEDEPRDIEERLNILRKKLEE